MDLPLGFSLLHPWAAGLGLAALGLPIAIHILTRPRPVRTPLSTVRFVRQAIEQKKARHRLRDILVLLFRAAAVGLLGFAFARPLIGAKPIVDPNQPGNAVRLIILDVSQSMAAVSDNSTAMDRAKSAAARYLRYSPGLCADVIIAGAKARPVFDRLSTNIAALRQAVSNATPLPQELNAQAAINLAGQMIATSPPPPGGRTELIIVSDFQRTNFASIDFAPVPRDVAIELESAAPAQTPENIAILRAGARGRLEQGRQARLESDIGNYSNSPRDIQVEMDLGSQAYHLHGLCPPGVTTTLSNLVTLPNSPGWIVGQAKLIGVTDALAADNARPVALDVRPLPVYALITSESSKPHPSSSHYLERALVPSKPISGQPSETVVRVDPAHLDREVVDAANLLVLDHPGNLSDDAINLLSTLARRGKGILYVAAEPADAENLARFQRAAGDDLKMPVEFTPPLVGQPRHDLFLLDWQHDQAPFDQLGDAMAAIAGNLRFDRGLSSHPLPGGLTDDVLAHFSDGSAALVVTACGAGNLAVLNADLAASNLRSSALFVPLIEELCGRLLTENSSTDAQACGEPLAVYLPPECGAARGLKIVPPQAGDENAGDITDDSTGTLWRADGLSDAGVYQIKRGDDTVFALPAAAPPLESDLQSIDPKTLTMRLAAGRRIEYRAADDAPSRDEVWAWLLVACAACLIFEIGVLKLLRT
jgi:hypothetical protein